MLSSSSDLIRAGIMPERSAEALALEECVDAEAREARDRMREVELALGLEVLLLLGRDDAVDQRASLLRRELVVVQEPFELAVDSNDRRRAGCHVEVRRVALDHDGEQVVNRIGEFLGT